MHVNILWQCCRLTQLQNIKHKKSKEKQFCTKKKQAPLMKDQNATNNKHHIIIDKLIYVDKTGEVDRTFLFFSSLKWKIFDCIKILNNPDIVNYRTSQVVLSLTIYETESHGYKDWRKCTCTNSLTHTHTHTHKI